MHTRDALQDELDSTPEIPFSGTVRDEHQTDYGNSGAYRDDGDATAIRATAPRRVFSSDNGNISALDEEDDAHPIVRRGASDAPPERGNARPVAAAGRGGGNGSGGARAPKTAYAKLRDMMPAFGRAELDEIHTDMIRNGAEDDDWLWTFGQSLLVAVIPLSKLTDNVKAALKSIVTDAAKELAAAAAHLNTDVVATRIVDGTLDQLGAAIEKEFGEPMRIRAAQEAEAHRMRWVALGVTAGAVLPILALVIGFLIGRSSDLGAYREDYMRQAELLPHISHFAQTDVGRGVMQFVDQNPDSTIRGIMSCSGALGLHVAVSTSGEHVCAGSVGARQGWRIK